MLFKNNLCFLITLIIGLNTSQFQKIIFLFLISEEKKETTDKEELKIMIPQISRHHEQAELLNNSNMDFFTLFGLCVVVYILIYVLCLSLLDCDLQLAYAERFGKKLSKLRGKVVWITGASSGIGEAMAYIVARHNGRLVLSARRVKHLQQVKKKCLQLNSYLKNEDVLVLKLDITETNRLQESLDQVLRQFGTLDILINNAGRSQRAVWENTESEVDRLIFEINVFGVISLSRLVVKYFNRKGKGRIAVTSSIAGLIGVPYSGSYTGTKHAIHGYFNGLRIEKLGEKINITLLCPGPTFSGLLEACFTEKAYQRLGHKQRITDIRMTSDRCAYLSLIAIVNDLEEVWMAVFPILPLTYAVAYCPNLSKKILNYMGAKRFQKLRNSRVTVKELHK